ncbi:hypothetical protein [Saccharothrix sp. HUAS TT1]|uniref:hypothetical protein n=1 Tax=unclassified Saccharothrix TaxID=2593673 RepID=UPI00345B8C88
MTKRKPIQHGTPAGFDRHRALGDEPCGECTAAAAIHAAYRQEVTDLLATGAAQVPLDLLGALLLAAPTELEERVEQVLGATCVEVAIDAAERAADDDEPLAVAS